MNNNSKQVKRPSTLKKRMLRVFKSTIVKAEKPDKTVEASLIVPGESVSDGRKRRFSFGPSQHLDSRIGVNGISGIRA